MRGGCAQPRCPLPMAGALGRRSCMPGGMVGAFCNGPSPWRCTTTRTASLCPLAAPMTCRSVRRKLPALSACYPLKTPCTRGRDDPSSSRGCEMRGHTRRVCVVGPSTRFLSGITYYTYSLCQALSARGEVSAILMRQLLPTRLYPGHARVGAAMSDLVLPDTVRRVEGVDWFWVPTLGRALRFLAHPRPDVLILQWWTGTVPLFIGTIPCAPGAARVVANLAHVLLNRPFGYGH